MSSPEQSVEQLIAAVRAGPGGPSVGAFFDFDGTLIEGYSVNAFVRHEVRRLEFDPMDAARSLLIGLRGVVSEEDFAEVLGIGMKAWSGRSEDQMSELGERLFVQDIAGWIYPEAWPLVAAHLARGHTVVLASSASRFQLEPTARVLGIEHVLCTGVEVVDGILTGRPAGPARWREGKAAGVREFAAEHGVDLAASYAYSNGDEDVPFLAAVGQPRALNPQAKLAAVAVQRGWPVARFTSRGRPTLAQLARTVATAGGMLSSFGTGLALGLLGGSRRRGVDLGITLAGEVGLTLAGVSVDVRGQENLVSHRPAVFLFNHQSQLDVLVLAKLLRGGFFGVAKKEVANNPLFGAVFRLADTAFVDRGNTAQAKAALEPAVQKLREGLSLVIAPEGTRSATPQLGRFKKGAFHIAMQAGVPVVPIVIRNTGELMWRNAKTVRSGTVEVVVLPPVATDGWTVEGLDQRVGEVREQYLDTLAHWPGGPDAGAPAGTPAPRTPAAGTPAHRARAPRTPAATNGAGPESAEPKRAAPKRAADPAEPASS